MFDHINNLTDICILGSEPHYIAKGGFLIDIRIILFQINAKILKGHPSLTIFLTLRTYLTFMSISHYTKVHDQAVLEILGFENLMIFADLENFS